MKAIVLSDSTGRTLVGRHLLHSPPARDRVTAAAEVGLDELTGCYLRAAGFLAFDREILEAERAEQEFVLAYIDIDGFRAVNDQQGEDVGDDLLREVAICLRGEFRAYDVIVRYDAGGFICGVAGLPLADFAGRLGAADFELHARKDASISFGLVERAPGEDLASLVGRADAAMCGAREQRRAGSLAGS